MLQERIVGRVGISQAELAKALGVSRFTINQVLGGRRAVTAEMALRLGHVLDTSLDLWLKLQAQVDLFGARRSAGAEIAKLARLRKADPEERSPAAECGSGPGEEGPASSPLSPPHLSLSVRLVIGRLDAGAYRGKVMSDVLRIQLL